MNLIAQCIRRPVATTLLSLAITLVGLLGLRLLPVAPLPQVDFPVIFVTASLPGADPETMATAVATPLERALGRIAGVNEMTSSSTLGNTRIILQFDLERDINGAARDVQAAINAAQAMLPSGMPRRPTYRKANPSAAPIMILSLTSQQQSPGEMYDVASTYLAQRLAQIEGVGDISISGSSLPAVRVELNPLVLFHQGISLDQVRQTISNANTLNSLGSVSDEKQQWQVGLNNTLQNADDYRSLVIRHQNENTVRLQDVARVEDSVQDVRNAGIANDQPAIALVIRKTAEANIIATIDRIRAELPALQAAIPASIQLGVAVDRSPTIRASLAEVQQTLLIAISLVILVVFLFLRSGRATLIPALVVPISLIGSFSALYVCGFSLNNLSLMALTIATGFVVDDAIVVLENISRHLEKGLSPFQAALQGSREVSFTVISMSLSLIAVFIPLLLMGGLPGRLFREFSVTLAVAIAISLFISLTLTPMMCAHLLKQAPLRSPRARFYPLFSWLQQGYAHTLSIVLRHARWVLLLLLGVIGLNIWLFINIPKTLFPEQDTGMVMGSIQADQNISFQAMQSKLARFVRILHQDPNVQSVIGFTGGSQTNSGSLFIALTPLSERGISARQFVDRMRSKLAQEPGARLFLMPMQDLRAGGRHASSTYQFTLQSDELSNLRTWTPKIRQALSQLSQLVDIDTDQQDRGSEIAITYDRDTLQRLGIPVSTINALLNNAFGQRQISTIYQPDNQYKVVMEVAPEFAQNSEALEQMFVINDQGQSIPLSYFARWLPANSPLAVNHQGLSASTTLSFNLAEGYSLSEASQAIEQAMVKTGVPSRVRGSFSGTAQLFKSTTQSQGWLILAAILTVYIVLGMLYESYIHPLTIISTLPSAGVGALLALELFSAPFSLIALIGIMLLIGIVKKNAIMMVDFALAAERQGICSPREAIFEACQKRFRPIMMTTLAAMLGALPLVLSRGDGAELRQPLGITIVGGLLVSQLLTLYTTPVVFLYFDRLRHWVARKRDS